MKKLNNDEICTIIDVLIDKKLEIFNEYDRDIKRGKLQGSVMDNIKADGLENYVNRLETLIDLFREEL